MVALRILAAVVSTFLILNAHAQTKKDVHGFYLGMSKADFLKNSQSVGLSTCQWKLGNHSLAASPEVASWIGVICPNHEYYEMSFAGHQTSDFMMSFSYRFLSKQSAENMDDEIAQQFGLKSKKDNLGLGVLYDLGESKMRLVMVSADHDGTGNHYELSLRAD